LGSFRGGVSLFGQTCRVSVFSSRFWLKGFGWGPGTAFWQAPQMILVKMTWTNLGKSRLESIHRLIATCPSSASISRKAPLTCSWVSMRSSSPGLWVLIFSQHGNSILGGELDFELRTLCLKHRCSTTWVTSLVHFFFLWYWGLNSELHAC
jgi:hypothetical protein